MKIKTASKVGTLGLIDIRGDGGLIVLPLSRVETGVDEVGRLVTGRYEIVSGDWESIDLSALPVFDAAWIPGWTDGATAAGERELSPMAANADHEALVADETFPPEADRVRLARAYLAKCPAAGADGRDRSAAAYKLACRAVGHFALRPDDAVDVMTEWGERDDQQDDAGNYWPWTEKQVRHKVTSAVRRVMLDPAQVGRAYDRRPGLERVDDSGLDELFGGGASTTVTAGPETAITATINVGGAFSAAREAAVAPEPSEGIRPAPTAPVARPEPAPTRRWLRPDSGVRESARNNPPVWVVPQWLHHRG